MEGERGRAVIVRGRRRAFLCPQARGGRGFQGRRSPGELDVRELSVLGAAGVPNGDLVRQRKELPKHRRGRRDERERA